MQKKAEQEEWERERRTLLEQEDMWSILADEPDILSIIPLHTLNDKIFKCPILINEEDYIVDVKIQVDRRIADVQKIKNQRSKEMYTWLADVVEEQGPDMVQRFGKVFQFGILDETDTEVPITIDFKNGRGDIFVGNPGGDDDGK